MQIVFASHNHHKLTEIQKLLPYNITLSSLTEEGILEDIEESFFTFQENAKAKALYVYQKTGKACFAEDSGLVVPALNGEPGVFSARYAGLPSNDQKNNEKLLAAIKEVSDKSAYYQTVICFINGEKTYYFEGKCHGTILTEAKGDGGFGYDPLFVPDGETRTFAEMSLDEKNKISHRAKAVEQFVNFLHDFKPAT